MTGTTKSSADLDPRRARALFRCWRRGMREMDLLLGQFADAQIATLPDSEIDQLEALMEEPDRDIFRWLTGEAPVDPAHDTPLWRRLVAFHDHQGPINV